MHSNASQRARKCRTPLALVKTSQSCADRPRTASSRTAPSRSGRISTVGKATARAPKASRLRAKAALCSRGRVIRIRCPDSGASPISPAPLHHSQPGLPQDSTRPFIQQSLGELNSQGGRIRARPRDLTRKIFLPDTSATMPASATRSSAATARAPTGTWHPPPGGPGTPVRPPPPTPTAHGSGNATAPPHDAGSPGPGPPGRRRSTRSRQAAVGWPRAPRPRRFIPAMASTRASTSPRRSLASRVSTFPRMGTTVRSGRQFST